MKNLVAMHPEQYAKVMGWTAKELDHVQLRKNHAYGFDGRIGPCKLRVRTSCLRGEITHYDTQSKQRLITLAELREMVRRYGRNHP